MFRIKICGVTNVADALAAVDAGADDIGLNFYPGSVRAITSEQAARNIREACGDSIVVYGVFVNHSQEDISRLRSAANLDGIQLHGDEPPELVAYWARARRDRFWGDIPRSLVIRARRLDERGMLAIRSDLEACQAAGGMPRAVLIDAARPGYYGGTGEMACWEELAGHKKWLGDVALILAGGLTPDNVAEAIRIVRPHGVDVASGVESSPGKKDHAKVRDFVAAAREAFAHLK